MADLLPPFAQPMVGRPTFDQMAERDNYRQPFYTSPMLTQQWPNPHAPHLSGMQHLDVRMFHGDAPHYPIEWPEIDSVNTPSTTGIQPEADYINAHPNPTNLLKLPENSRIGSGLASSPHSSHGSMSPMPSPMPIGMENQPNFGGSLPVTERRSTNSSNSSFSKPRGASEEDTEYVPAEDPKRGRKRQRIPHTAVERRYRENLNAHLDRLRQNVPHLAVRKSPGAAKGHDGSEGVKPSKCEILSGAIEHIGSLDRENAALRNRVRALEAKVGDMDNWYRANGR